MNKINHKAIFLVFLLQVLVGFLWYSAAPAALIDPNQGMAKLPSIERLVGFFCCLICVFVLYRLVVGKGKADVWFFNDVAGVRGVGVCGIAKLPFH